MATLTDLFPSPSLDGTRWNSVLGGSGSIGVGTPSDGIYFSGVDDDGDSAVINSDEKVYIPAGLHFDMRIAYNDIGEDPDQNLYAFLGWRSMSKSGGVPLYGVDVLFMRDTGGNFYFQKRTTSLGTVLWSNIKADPTGGGNGQLRIDRSGFVYSLYYYDSSLAIADWVKLQDITMADNSAGFATFGYFAENPASPSFPLILGT